MIRRRRDAGRVVDELAAAAERAAR